MKITEPIENARDLEKVLSKYCVPDEYKEIVKVICIDCCGDEKAEEKKSKITRGRKKRKSN